MTSWTNQSKILSVVIIGISINVIDLQWNSFFKPMSQSAALTLVSTLFYQNFTSWSVVDVILKFRFRLSMRKNAVLITRFSRGKFLLTDVA